MLRRRLFVGCALCAIGRFAAASVAVRGRVPAMPGFIENSLIALEPEVNGNSDEADSD